MRDIVYMNREVNKLVGKLTEDDVHSEVNMSLTSSFAMYSFVMEGYAW